MPEQTTVETPLSSLAAGLICAVEDLVGGKMVSYVRIVHGSVLGSATEPAEPHLEIRRNARGEAIVTIKPGTEG